jgi:hypothetical protein
VNGKPTKTREELAAIIMERLKAQPECGKITGVVIAPISQVLPGAANWHAAFTTQGKTGVPRIAWRIGSQIADKFDLATRP